jgi:hypothetical protein
MISKLLYLFALVPFAFIICHFAGKRKWIIFFSIAHGLLLTILTAFVFNQPGWLWHEIPPSLFTEKTYDQKYNADYQYIHDNFIFIDNSLNKQLVNDPFSDKRDSSKIIITDRSQLINAFQLLDTNSAAIDLVIGDIGFENPTSDDSLLKVPMHRLDSLQKLLLASAPDDEENEYLSFPKGTYGNVSEETTDKLWTSHKIFTNNRFSLPYKIYTMLDKPENIKRYLNNIVLKETDSAKKNHWAVNIFQPSYTVTNENILFNGITYDSINPAGLNNFSETIADNTYLFTLGEINGTRRDEFIELLHDRRKNNQRNCIFIGAFSSPEDTHMTLRGQLHGATILVNTFMQLHRHAHYLTAGYLLLLFIGFSLISFLLFMPLIGKKIYDFDHWKYKNLTLRVIGASLSFLWKELYLVLLVIVALLAEKYTSHYVNIIFLVIYIGAFSHLIKFLNPLNNHKHA